MSKEFRLKHEAISDSQTITQVTTEAFEKEGLNIHVNEVENLEDDFNKGERILKIKNTKFFVIGNIPWHKRQPMGY